MAIAGARAVLVAPLAVVARIARASDAGGLSISNSLSGSDRELRKVPAVGDPTHPVQRGGSARASTGERQRRVAVQGGMAACRVVVALELAKLPLKITAVPEQQMVEELR